MSLALLLAVATAADSTCAQNLARLDAKIRENYAGFTIEMVGSKRVQYETMLLRLKRQSANVTGDACFPLLNALTGSFHDPHLFLFQSTRLDTAETTRRVAAVATRNVTETIARQRLNVIREALDPIEGIWYDRGLRVAVLADPAGQRRTFTATILTPDSSTWKPGDVRARFLKLADGSYAADVSERNHALRHLTATLHRGVLMRLSPGIWGKAYPLPLDATDLPDPVDAHRATFRERDGAVIIAIPSHDPAYRAAFDSLLVAHRDALLSARTLVIDLRGNEGGSSGMTRALRPYYISANDRAPADDRDAGMLSSPDQITYVARGAIGDTLTPEIGGFLKRLRANPGKLVPFYDSATAAPTDPPSAEAPAPGQRAVGFLIDHGTVSASEAMLVAAKRNPAVKVFGEESAGALEYQSVSIVSFKSSEARWYLGYPTITGNIHRAANAPRHGIVPDVAIDLKRSTDPVGDVIARLATK